MYDEDIEKTVLYYLIFEKEAINVDEEDFFIQKHRQIIKAILELKNKKEEINILSIKEKIKGKDTDILRYISNIAECKYGSSIQYAYRELKRLSKKRKLIKLSNEIKENVENERETEIYIEKLIKQLNEINQEAEKEKTFLDIVCETSDIIEKKRTQGTKYDYKYFTGIFDLDKVTNGLHEEELTIVGARPRSRKNNICITNSTLYSRKRNTSRNC
jgi:replicative DNA helicase